MTQKIEELLEKPCWVVDILPERVPEGSPGQFFAVEAYYLRPERLAGIRRKFTDLLLKLNCYDQLRIVTEEGTEAPSPEELDRRIAEGNEDLLFLLSGDALVTLNRDDIYLSVYGPDETLLERIGKLAAAEGLFLRKAYAPAYRVTHRDCFQAEK